MQSCVYPLPPLPARRFTPSSCIRCEKHSLEQVFRLLNLMDFPQTEQGCASGMIRGRPGPLRSSAIVVTSDNCCVTPLHCSMLSLRSNRNIVNDT